MKRVILNWLCFILLVSYPSFAVASLNVTVINQTGYDLSDVKYVYEVGAHKTLSGQTQQLTNGGFYNFALSKGGIYRVYASFMMDGRKVYAKGTANNLEDGEQYTLTLMKVMLSRGGSGLNFINRSEFDSIK